MVLRDHAVPRTLRIEYEGAICHVLNRGDRREPIFRDDADRKRFLETLGEACVKTDWQIHALCLMGNYFHLVVETPEGNLVEGMKWFSGHLHGAVQPAAQVVRSSVQRALQGAGGGCGSAGLLPHGVRVCALESGAGEIAEAGAIAAGLRLEQLPGTPQTAAAALAVAAGGAVVRRDAVAQGQRGGAARIRAATGNAAARSGRRSGGVGFSGRTN